ncbi:hypothetical protein D3C87_1986370 [compost metagenome]
MAGAAIAAGASGERADEINFREEFQIVARPHRACLHEILMRIAGETRAHKDVQNIVYMRFRLAE